VKLNAKKFEVSLIVLALVFSAYQISIYRDYAIEATWLQTLRIINVAEVNDLRKLGAICNSVSRPKCSRDIFKNILHIYPNDREALANLAIAYSMLGKHEKANLYYKAYFSSGRPSGDIILSYAKSLLAQNLTREALPLLYSVLYDKDDSIEVAQTLIGALNSEHKYLEKLSLLTSLVENSRDELVRFHWQKEINRNNASNEKSKPIERKVASVNHSEDGAKQELILPSLDGRKFYIPIATDKDKFQFLTLVDGQTETIISEKDILALKLKVSRLSTQKVVIQNLAVGYFSPLQVEAQVCNDCLSQLGSRALAQLGAHIDGRGKIPYLILAETTKE
jgi:hypothetical protein